jgi:hypothetical protein
MRTASPLPPPSPALWSIAAPSPAPRPGPAPAVPSGLVPSARPLRVPRPADAERGAGGAAGGVSSSASGSWPLTTTSAGSDESRRSRRPARATEAPEGGTSVADLASRSASPPSAATALAGGSSEDSGGHGPVSGSGLVFRDAAPLDQAGLAERSLPGTGLAAAGESCASSVVPLSVTGLAGSWSWVLGGQGPVSGSGVVWRDRVRVALRGCVPCWSESRCPGSAAAFG